MFTGPPLVRRGKVAGGLGALGADHGAGLEGGRSVGVRGHSGRTELGANDDLQVRNTEPVTTLKP